MKINVGMESTGPHWLPFARWLKSERYWIVTVDLVHVKKSNDARVIAQLIKDARFSPQNLLEGIYEEFRNAKKFE